MYRIVFWTLWEKVKVGWFGRMALKHVYDHMWNKSPVQVRCMKQGAQGWCTGMTQRDRMEREVGGGFRMGKTCTPMADSCQCTAKPLHYCKVISLQLKWINFQKKEGWWTKTTETGMKYLLPPSNTAKTTLRLTKDTNVWKLDHPGAGKWFPFKAKQ